MAALVQKLEDEKATSPVNELIEEAFIDKPVARVIDFSEYRSHANN